MTLRIQCWSGPRNASTALMYSWRQRADTTVVDEPLYSHFLAESGRPDPGRDAVLASRPTDARRLVQELVLHDPGTPVLYCKQIATHLRGVDPGFLDRTENLLLIRHPREVLRSWSIRIAAPTLADTGLEEQVVILDHLLAAGRPPLVVDARALRSDPEGVLSRMCDHAGLDFDPAMLSWPPGPKPEDGVWAPHWYDAVHRSTGFSPPPPPPGPLAPSLEELVARAEPLYHRLLARTPDHPP